LADAHSQRRFALIVAGLLLLALAVALLAPGHLGGQASAKKKRGGKAKVGFIINTNPTPLQASGANQLKNQLYAPCPGTPAAAAGGFGTEAEKRKYWPYGGAEYATPPPGGNGEGAYPLGFERRGAQNDVHFILMDFGPMGNFTGRMVFGQAVCGPKPRGLVPVQNLIQVDPGQTKTVTSTCPPGRFLIGGNFARTFFTEAGGDFVTQAEADIPSNSFIVSAAAFGSFGGPVLDTAFCANTQSYTGTVSGPVTIPPHSTATVTSPPCPVGNRVVWGGFDSKPAGAAFLGNTTFNLDQSYSASAYNRTGAPATLESYAYCLAKNAFKHKF
jgi:hypothetical protein